jgi:hypothetical protein
MPGKGVGEEVMPKNLQSEKRAFDKRAVAREKVIVPEELTGKRWRSDGDADDQEQKRAQPILTE